MYFYCLPIKLGEGNVLSHVMSTRGGPHVTITNDALDVTVQGPPPLDMFKLV